MSGPRLLDAATVQESHERFLPRAIEHEVVWTVWGDGGPLVVPSHGDSDDDELVTADEARLVHLFFSDIGVGG